MLLSEVFPPELIKVGLEAETKEELFEEMVDQFCNVLKPIIREDIIEALYERELKMSTGIFNGIAIPHCKTNVIENTHGVLGISRKGISYNALDGQPVYLLFMFLSPQNDSEKYLWLLKCLSNLLENPRFYSELLEQKNAEGVHEILKKYEDIFIQSC